MRCKTHYIECGKACTLYPHYLTFLHRSHSHFSHTPCLVPPPPILQHRVRLSGSCTALVAVLRHNGMLDVQLVGDCGLRLIREGEVVLATEVRGACQGLGLECWGLGGGSCEGVFGEAGFLVQLAESS
jgi:hypothetical protein